jgi:hypothetical protein
MKLKAKAKMKGRSATGTYTRTLNHKFYIPPFLLEKLRR